MHKAGRVKSALSQLSQDAKCVLSLVAFGALGLTAKALPVIIFGL